MKIKMSERGKNYKLPLTELTAISPVDGRYRERISSLAPFVSEYGLIKNRIEIEAKFLVTLSEAGAIRNITSIERNHLNSLSDNLSISEVEKVKEIELETRHDVKAMERAMRNMVKGTTLADLTEKIHLGLTSEDVNNLAYRLLLQRATKKVLIPELERLIVELADRSQKYRNEPMLARTHGQPAVPTTLGKEFVNFAMRLVNQSAKLKEKKLTGKINGAVGNYNALSYTYPSINWIKVSEKFVKQFDLEPNITTTQINPYDDIVEYLQTYHRINSIVLDLDNDMWGYISDNYFKQKIKKGETGSSTMPQKVNPIDFENSEGNIAIANGLIETLSRKLPISRFQRDLSDSTVIRNTGNILAHSLLSYKGAIEGLSRSEPNVEKIMDELNNNWNILGEAAQTLLRKEGTEDPYTLISQLTKGFNISSENWIKWVEDLPVSIRIKKKLLKLTPENYVGEAGTLTDLALKKISKKI